MSSITSNIGSINNYGKTYSIFSTSLDANNLIKENVKLSPNSIIISSPTDGNNDIKKPALFVTDSNGNVEQLTYTLSADDFNFEGNEAKLKTSPSVKINKLENLVNAIMRLPDIKDKFFFSYSQTNNAYIADNVVLSYYGNSRLAISGRYNMNINAALLPLEFNYNNYNIKKIDMEQYKENYYTTRQDIPLYYYPNNGSISLGIGDYKTEKVQLKDTIQDITYILNATTYTVNSDFFSNSTTIYLYFVNRNTNNKASISTITDYCTLYNLETGKHTTVVPFFKPISTSSSSVSDGLFDIPGSASTVSGRLSAYLINYGVISSETSLNEVDMYLATNNNQVVLRNNYESWKDAFYTYYYFTYYYGNVKTIRYSYTNDIHLPSQYLYYKVNESLTSNSVVNESFFIPNTLITRLT